MVLQRNQPLALLIGSGVGALAAAPLLTKREHQQKRDWQALRAGMTAIQNSLAAESARVSLIDGKPRTVPLGQYQDERHVC